MKRAERRTTLHVLSFCEFTIGKPGIGWMPFKYMFSLNTLLGACVLVKPVMIERLRVEKNSDYIKYACLTLCFEMWR